MLPTLDDASHQGKPPKSHSAQMYGPGRSTTSSPSSCAVRGQCGSAHGSPWAVQCRQPAPEGRFRQELAATLALHSQALAARPAAGDPPHLGQAEPALQVGGTIPAVLARVRLVYVPGHIHLHRIQPARQGGVWGPGRAPVAAPSEGLAGL